MRLTILGSGTNIHPTRAAAGYLVRTDHTILLDFGPTHVDESPEDRRQPASASPTSSSPTTTPITFPTSSPLFLR